MNRNWPSYSPLVSEIAGWWVSPQVIVLAVDLALLQHAFEFSSKP
jgi:hypothetical protein